MAGTVLILSNDKEKVNKIESLCTSLDIALRRLSQRDINTPLGEILGMPVNKSQREKAPVLYIPPEIMLFSGVADSTLDTFLDRYKQANIAFIPFKGVVTPTNISWSIYKLILEYEKENKSYEQSISSVF